jgi:hypothetical protein
VIVTPKDFIIPSIYASWFKMFLIFYVFLCLCLEITHDTPKLNSSACL